MPFNGNGTFSRIYSWVVDAANNVNISSSRTDAEMNGFAAGLTNCITRDGQSPPSADIPWGAKRITNLGAAAVGTDALNRDTADARYILTGITALTLSGALSAGSLSVGATAAITGNATVGGTFGATGDATFSGVVNLAVNNKALTFKDANGGAPELICQADNNFVFYGTDIAGAQRALWSVFMHSSTSFLTFLTHLTSPTAAGGDNSTKLATTAYVQGEIAGKAPLASPTLTGTPAAPTATAGTATTQLATTAFVDALRDVPSNAKAANYALALTDRGGGVDFNGTSLTCTIPANASVAFPLGTTIILTNLNATALSIAITTDTLTLAGSTTTGARTLAQNGIATLRKVGATSWLISGAGLS